MTLDAIKEDLTRQKHKLEKEYVQLAGQFAPEYEKLDRRVWKYRAILITVLGLCAAGLTLTWIIFLHLTSVSHVTCLYPAP